jgi:hypothetical protein
LVFTPQGGENFSHRGALTPSSTVDFPGGGGGLYPPSSTAAFLGGGGLPPEQHGGRPGGGSGCVAIWPPLPGFYSRPPSHRLLTQRHFPTPRQDWVHRVQMERGEGCPAM